MRKTETHIWKTIVTFLTAIAILAMSVGANAGDTLNRVRSEKILRCGVSEGITGFSIRDTSGRWTGMDADFCRAVAAAVGPNVRVEFVPLTARARFVALQMNNIDLLSRNTTWTIGREAYLDVLFAGVLYFDEQVFMVARKSRIIHAKQLKGATICVKKGTTSEMNLEDYSNKKALNLKPLVLHTQDEVNKAFFAGRCKAYTSDYSILASERLKAPGGSQQYIILPERISKEPTGPVVRGGDEEWFRLVKWVLFALIESEERGITRENVATIRKTTKDPAVRRLLGVEGGFGKALDTDNDWTLRTIQATGNYGDIFERNLGQQSKLKLDRGYNRLATKGGLMWAPPFR